MDILQIKNLKVSFKTMFGKVNAVDNISFSLKKGEVLGIVGESGSGKSVTSLSVMNLIEGPHGKIESGEIIYEDRDILKLKDKEMCKIRGSKISMIFQEPMTSLNPVFTVYKQINEVYKIHSEDPKKDNKKEIIKILEQLNIASPEEVINKYPFQLSGGMRQRIMIAMAIVNNPKIIIADEPTTALDVTTQGEILSLLKDINKRSETSIMFITHDLGIIAELAQRVVVMYRGKILEECTVLEFFDNPMHPYSKGLINSMPDNFNGRFNTISGNVPSLYENIEGCPYASRCSQVMDICREKEPCTKELKDDHKVCCWLFNDGKGEGL
ncbi:ABC transporter ATP-binding protein [Clostridium sp. MSJ-4]|uniref:ABC transporter ATP-binding protein n=1 Tax=Clostridium simiarum TaxID=2841506 RepID=A0ABS6F2G8_9CLOT|nr:ABC transporter ATP-binding protein [Clostridium simiarum]MBU5592680.1 ABC transporter ATP-binding protein [Clostridium simiarum]